MPFLPSVVDMAQKNIREATKSRLAMDEYEISTLVVLDELPIAAQEVFLHQVHGNVSETAKAVMQLAVNALVEYRGLSSAESYFLVERVWTVESMEVIDAKLEKVPSFKDSFSKDYAQNYKTRQQFLQFILETINELIKRAQHEAVIESMIAYRDTYSAFFSPKTEFIFDKDIVFRRMRGEVVSDEELKDAAKRHAKEAMAILYATAVHIHKAAYDTSMQLLMNAVAYQLLKDVFSETQNSTQTYNSEPTKLKGEKV